MKSEAETRSTAPAAPATATILWALSFLASLFFLATGAAKLTGHAPTVAAFEAWGYGRGFLLAVGGLEMVGAVALLVPRTTTWGAALLALEMLGAIYTVLSTGLGILPLPVVCLVVLLLLGYHRRHRAIGLSGR